VSWLIVLALGAVGAALRFAAARWSPLLGIAAVNVGAAFVLGLVADWDGIAATGVRVGLLGAMSTWSTLAQQVGDLVRGRRWFRAAAYLGGTLVAGVGAAWVGLRLN
jgi:CrcB protein